MNLKTILQLVFVTGVCALHASDVSSNSIEENRRALSAPVSQWWCKVSCRIGAFSSKKEDNYKPRAQWNAVLGAEVSMRWKASRNNN